ncbi:E3 ubiquitin-protein ligase MARCHF11-like [Motacilla alba alba]|uniref:E3 ubiquitin-protein ligase MARCHF11-like n=1 Tax=Motacilla alba alba TaxID=1094192 RepID=UPI0018D4F454|nr:E3 ubiquitin-protein ligase MARCHF11-like [Motacilla alba alba]
MEQIPSLALRLRCKTHAVQLLQSPKPTLQSRGLLKTDKRLTGDPSFHLLTVPWISRGFVEHTFSVQHGSPPHFSSSACRCRNARPCAGEGGAFRGQRRPGPCPPGPCPPGPCPPGPCPPLQARPLQARRGAAAGQPLSQLRSHTLGCQTRPDSVPKPSLPSTTAVISEPTQQVPGVRNASKERSRAAGQPRSACALSSAPGANLRHGKTASGKRDVAACALCQPSVLCASCTDSSMISGILELTLPRED